MSQKQTVKICIDILMTLSLLFLMGYPFWGDAAHEWAGCGMFVLFLLHHGLNAGWHAHLAKGRYTPLRAAMLVIDLLLLLAMLALMFSGVVLSRHVFAFAQLRGYTALARKLHILGSYWGFFLMSVHLGLHWHMILSMLRKKLSVKPSKLRSAILWGVSAVAALYGVSVFIRRNFIEYLFLRSEFVFFDYAEPKLWFYLDYLSLMILCIFAAQCVSFLLHQKKRLS